MIKVKMRESIASSEGWAYGMGQIVEIDNDLAEKWIVCKLAEPVEIEPKSNMEDDMEDELPDNEFEAAIVRPPETAMMKTPIKKTGGKR